MVEREQTLLFEEAYFKTLKAFAAGSYSLKKELSLSLLRQQLGITDQRHGFLRKLIEEGKEYNERNADLPRQSERPATATSALEQPNAKRKRPHNTNGYREEFVKPSNPQQPPTSPFSQAGPGSKRSAVGPGKLEQVPAKRQKREGPGGEGAPRLPIPGDINELIGYKIQRFWPENGGWFHGAITDYRAATGEHCVVYDMNTADESYEWFNISKAKRSEFRLLNEKINIIEHAPKTASQAPSKPPRQPGFPERGIMNGRGQERGDGRFPPYHDSGRKGHSSQEFDQTAYQPPNTKGNGVSARPAFVADSDDDISSDESFSE